MCTVSEFAVERWPLAFCLGPGWSISILNDGSYYRLGGSLLFFDVQQQQQTSNTIEDWAFQYRRPVDAAVTWTHSETTQFFGSRIWTEWDIQISSLSDVAHKERMLVYQTVVPSGYALFLFTEANDGTFAPDRERVLSSVKSS